jgi:cell division septation protein DedD
MIKKWVAPFLIILLFLPNVIYSNGFPSKKKGHHITYISKFNQSEQVGAFKSKKNAEKFVKKLKTDSFKTEIRRVVTKDKKVLYKVFVKRDKKPLRAAESSSGVKLDTTLEPSYREDKPVVRERPSWEPKKPSKATVSSGEVKQIATFKIFSYKDSAEKFAKKLKNEGFEVTIRKGITKDKKAIYTVFAGKHREPSGVALSSSEIKKVAVLEMATVEDKPAVQERLSGEHREPSKVPVPSGEVRQIADSEKSSIEDKPVVIEMPSVGPKELSEGAVSSIEVKHDTSLETIYKVDKPLDTESHTGELKEPPKKALSSTEVKDSTDSGSLSLEEKPIGTEKTSWDVFGRGGGYLHPFLSISEYYTDNVFNANGEKKSDFITVISPGIWLTVPHVYEKLLNIETSNIAPGGFSLSRSTSGSFRRYQTYLFYGADIERFSKYSSEDVTSHKLEGLLQYNLRGGLSIELADQYLASHDAMGTGISSELDKYKTNLSNLILTYDALEKIKFRIDYSNFLVNYDASRNDFRDRADNAFSGYIFYKFQPKTSVFIEYDFIDINYDESALFDSKEYHYFGGLQWDMTAKSKGSVKAGYGVKNFSVSSIGDAKDFILEAQIDHQFTPKTSVKVKASRKTNETNISTTDFILSNNIEVQYLQRLTGKITGDVNFSYTNDSYKGNLTFGGETKERKDDTFGGAFALRYKFKEWLQLDTGYIYTKRGSNFSDFDYTSNIVFIRIAGSL